MNEYPNGTRLVAQHQISGETWVISVRDDGVWACVGPVVARDLQAHDLDDFNLDSEDADWLNMNLGAFACYTQNEFRAEHPAVEA